MTADPQFEQVARLLGADDVDLVSACWSGIANLGIPADLLETLLDQLQALLPGKVDTDRVLINLQRFLEASRSPQSWLALFEREPDALATLVQLFSTSQYMADMLIADPEAFDLLRLTAGLPVEAGILQDEILAEVAATTDARQVMRVLRDYRHRETLRIAYGDFISNQPVETVTGQISLLTEAILGAAVFAAQRDMESRRRRPVAADGRPLRFAVVALGKLGGAELNYSSDIDLVFIYESRKGPATSRPQTSGVAAGDDEYFQRLGQRIVKLLSESTPRGIAYRVDMRLRPHGRGGPLVVSFDEAVSYYDSAGRTWERQAFVKARAVAGDIELGDDLIDQLQPWIYRRYLMRADITGIAALKRRIEQRSRRAGDDHRNVKLGHGGIRDIEFVIQFLQLLHGGDLPGVRCTNTLEAIRRLQQAGCITAEEQSWLEDNYRFLRRVEHYLQIMYDRQTHCLPDDQAEFHRIAVRIGYRDTEQAAADAFREELRERTSRNRRILDHLLHEAFAGDETSREAAPESDLILDPEPAAEVIRATLEPFGFADCDAAYRNLQDLACESIAFLSTRRCRHFLAAIAPKLLAAIASTPNPDATLISLANVSASLGGKAVLWELFSINPPSMDLCVRLCASSPYLASILTSNPGMLDELMDSLMLDSLPDHDELSRGLEDLCRNAVDIAPILHSFKNSMHLRVGVRDILGKHTIAETHAALSDIAEVCMEQVIHHEFHRLIHQLGMPVHSDGPAAGQPAELVLLAVGKLGGREPNYHSDLDVIFLFDGEGATKSLVPSRRFEPTTNRHFFNQLCQRVIQTVTRIGSTGRLYDLDVRLRPLGRSGELAITIDDLKQYFTGGGGQVWERQALCKARPIWGSSQAQAAAMNCVHSILSGDDWSPEFALQIREHRLQLQRDAAEGNLKRGIGGTMDVEFVVQLLQLACSRAHPEILVPGTFAAIERLRCAGLLDEDISAQLFANYEFLRRVESGIRLMNMSARHELPADHLELSRLVFLLNSSDPELPANSETLVDLCERTRRSCREIFESVFDRWMPEIEPADVAES